MKKIIILVLMTMCISLISNAQNYEKQGTTFVSKAKEKSKQEPTKTKFTWKDNKGIEYPIYISSTGSCFIIKTSTKTGKEYRNYLGPEISTEVCKELGIEYKGKKK